MAGGDSSHAPAGQPQRQQDADAHQAQQHQGRHTAVGGKHKGGQRNANVHGLCRMKQGRGEGGREGCVRADGSCVLTRCTRACMHSGKHAMHARAEEAHMEAGPRIQRKAAPDAGQGVHALPSFRACPRRCTQCPLALLAPTPAGRPGGRTSRSCRATPRP